MNQEGSKKGGRRVLDVQEENLQMEKEKMRGENHE